MWDYNYYVEKINRLSRFGPIHKKRLSLSDTESFIAGVAARNCFADSIAGRNGKINSGFWNLFSLTYLENENESGPAFSDAQNRAFSGSSLIYNIYLGYNWLRPLYKSNDTESFYNKLATFRVNGYNYLYKSLYTSENGLYSNDFRKSNLTTVLLGENTKLLNKPDSIYNEHENNITYKNFEGNADIIFGNAPAYHYSNLMFYLRNDNERNVGDLSESTPSVQLRLKPHNEYTVINSNGIGPHIAGKWPEKSRQPENLATTARMYVGSNTYSKMLHRAHFFNLLKKLAFIDLKKQLLFYNNFGQYGTNIKNEQISKDLYESGNVGVSYFYNAENSFRGKSTFGDKNAVGKLVDYYRNVSLLKKTIQSQREGRALLLMEMDITSTLRNMRYNNFTKLTQSEATTSKEEYLGTSSMFNESFDNIGVTGQTDKYYSYPRTDTYSFMKADNINHLPGSSLNISEIYKMQSLAEFIRNFNDYHEIAKHNGNKEFSYIGSSELRNFYHQNQVSSQRARYISRNLKAFNALLYDNRSFNGHISKTPSEPEGRKGSAGYIFEALIETNTPFQSGKNKNTNTVLNVLPGNYESLKDTGIVRHPVPGIISGIASEIAINRVEFDAPGSIGRQMISSPINPEAFFKLSAESFFNKSGIYNNLSNANMLSFLVIKNLVGYNDKLLFNDKLLINNMPYLSNTGAVHDPGVTSLGQINTPGYSRYSYYSPLYLDMVSYISEHAGKSLDVTVLKKLYDGKVKSSVIDHVNPADMERSVVPFYSRQLTRTVNETNSFTENSTKASDGLSINKAGGDRAATATPDNRTESGVTINPVFNKIAVLKERGGYAISPVYTANTVLSGLLPFFQKHSTSTVDVIYNLTLTSAKFNFGLPIIRAGLSGKAYKTAGYREEPALILNSILNGTSMYSREGTNAISPVYAAGDVLSGILPPGSLKQVFHNSSKIFGMLDKPSAAEQIMKLVMKRGAQTGSTNGYRINDNWKDGEIPAAIGYTRPNTSNTDQYNIYGNMDSILLFMPRRDDHSVSRTNYSLAMNLNGQNTNRHGSEKISSGFPVGKLTSPILYKAVRNGKKYPGTILFFKGIEGKAQSKNSNNSTFNTFIQDTGNMLQNNNINNYESVTTTGSHIYDATSINMENIQNKNSNFDIKAAEKNTGVLSNPGVLIHSVNTLRTVNPEIISNAKKVQTSIKTDNSMKSSISNVYAKSLNDGKSTKTYISYNKPAEIVLLNKPDRFKPDKTVEISAPPPMEKQDTVVNTVVKTQNVNTGINRMDKDKSLEAVFENMMSSNMNRFVDRIYSQFERRLKLEKVRRGV